MSVQVLGNAEGVDEKLKEMALGDTVALTVPSLGIDINIRVTQYSYNCLLERYDSLEMGTADTLQAMKMLTSTARAAAGGSGTTSDMEALTSQELQALMP